MALLGALGAVLPAAWSAALARPYVLHTLMSFCSNSPVCTQGVNPESGLLMDQSRNLYGTTVAGGLGYGTVFELVRGGGGWSYKLLYDFCSLSACDDGISPKAGLIMDNAGNLYGTASRGGPNSGGVVFELTLVAKRWTYKVLYAFCSRGGCTDGSQPSGTDIGVNVNLTYDGAASGQAYDGVSPLYGTTESGGAGDAGTVFSLTPGDPNWTETVLYNFCSQAGCADGSAGGNLIYNSGILYGTTAFGHGSLFKLTTARHVWSLTTLYAFCSAAGCADGDVPNALVMDSGGNFFGTTSAGGTGVDCQVSAGCGVAFELLKSKHPQETVLYNFCSTADCSDGAQPAPGIVLDSVGNLYGATNLGGSLNCLNDSACGVVFEIGAAGEQVLHAFCPTQSCTEGTSPDAGPILDSAGNLFGTTEFGGNYGGGTAYELAAPK